MERTLDFGICPPSTSLEDRSARKLERISIMDRTLDFGICSPSPSALPSTVSLPPWLSNRAMAGGTGPQQLTIFYGGKVSVCEVTDDQARAIMRLAMEEQESNSSSERATSPSDKKHALAYQQGLCMKRSLQRFLQKRKARSREASPYHQP